VCKRVVVVSLVQRQDARHRGRPPAAAHIRNPNQPGCSGAARLQHVHQDGVFARTVRGAVVTAHGFASSGSMLRTSSPQRFKQLTEELTGTWSELTVAMKGKDKPTLLA
jgi:hypothetical protein